MPRRYVWLSFIPWSTIVPAVAVAAAWRLVWGDWTSGLLVASLLSVHEGGHLLVAAWRRLPVRRAPLFLPGLGGFQPTAAAAPADRVWLLLGGPLLGSCAALAAKLAGLHWGAPALAFAGDFALLINLVNLAPVPPLDGGLLVLETGWFGLLPAAFVAGYLVAYSLSMVVLGFAFLGLIVAVRFVLQARPASRGGRVTAFALYGAATLAVLAAARLSGHVSWPPLLSTGALSTIVLAPAVAGVLVRRVFQPGTIALVRYGAAGLLGWPYYLAFRPSVAAYMLALTSHLFGLPGLRWLRMLLAAAEPADFPAGWGVAWAYDCLVLQGRLETAAVWLEEAPHLLQAAGVSALREAAARLEVLGYAESAAHLRSTWGQAIPVAARSWRVASAAGGAPMPLEWDLHDGGVQTWLAEWLAATVPPPPSPAAPPPPTAEKSGLDPEGVLLLLVAAMVAIAGVGATLGLDRRFPPLPPPGPGPSMASRDVSGAAILLGDAAETPADLATYQSLFTQTVLPALAQDTGQRPGANPPEIAIYGDAAAWQAVVDPGLTAFYNDRQQRIYLAGFRLRTEERPGALAAMYTLWLFDADGGDDPVLPFFASGVAAHEAARTTEGRDDWNTDFYARQWRVVTGDQRGSAVPILGIAKSDDPFSLAAVGYLLTERGRAGLPNFFAARRAGKSYRQAFISAFNATPEQFQDEFSRAVAARRAGAGGR